METKRLMKEWPKFISYLDEQGYCKAHKDAFRVEIARILKKIENGSFSTYSDHLTDFKNAKPRSESSLRKKRHVVEMIKRFDLYGYYPDKMVRFDAGKERIYEVLTPSYKEMIDTYQDALVKKGLRDSTIYSDVITAKYFLKHLQDSGILNLSCVNESIVHEMFYKDGSKQRGYDFSFGVRRFMRVMESFIGKEIADRICTYLPVSARTHKPYDAITNEELEKLKAVLLDDSYGFSLRDRAIMIIAIYTGLRRSDIANLLLDDIDWDNDKIKIALRKTGIPIVLPLRPVVGNIVYDYITKERPHSDLPYLFLSTRKGQGHGKIVPTSFAALIYKFFDAAGIRKNGENRGLHMFRHHVATSLINHGHDTPIVMSVLGHTAPLAVDYYLESDYTQLKECGIDISCWPMRKEVLL